MDSDRLALAASIAVILTLAYALATNDVYAWKLISALGEERAYMAFSIALYTLASLELGILTLSAIAVSGSLCALVKDIAAIPRPPPELWRVEVSGYAFPSGHAMVSATFWSTLLLATQSCCLLILSVLIIASISYSRIALRVHYPLDVVGGVALGVLIALLVCLTRNRFKSPRYVYATSVVGFTLGVIGGLVYGDSASYKLAGVSLALSSYTHIYEHRYILREASPVLRVASLITAFSTALAFSSLVDVAALPAFLTTAAYTLITLTVAYTPLLVASFKKSLARVMK